MTFSKQISSLSSACHYHIRDFRRIRHTLDFKTASTIATSHVHSKLDYCNSLYINLPANQTSRLQILQNTLARTITKSPKHDHITPTLKFLHWIKIEQRIQNKIISLSYNILQNSQPSHLRNLLVIQPPRSTRSSDFIILTRPFTTSRSLKISNRSFRHAAPALWNKLPLSLRTFSANYSPTTSHSPCVALSRDQFLFRLKTYLFSKSYPA